MFLVLTADQRFWKADEEVLFLGEWCKRYNQKHIWSNLCYQVLPYHWSDRRKFYQDHHYLQTLYERYLEHLACLLNEIHGVDHSVRYWRILLGGWMISFVPVFYDAYFSVKSAINSGVVSNVWLSDTAPGKYLPDNTQCQTDGSWVVNDEGYRHYLYSWIIKETDQIPWEAIPEWEAPPTFSSSFSAKRIIENFFGVCGRLLPYSWKWVILDSGFSWREVIRLQISLGQFHIPLFPDVPVPNSLPDWPLRNELLRLPADSEFESILNKIIPVQLPTIFLEGYSKMRERSLSAFPRKPKVMISSTGLYPNDGFKFWAGHQVESRAKLICVQHGGGYGSFLLGWVEDHEKKCADRFFSWGWKERGNPVVIPMPSPALIRKRSEIKPDPNGRILWVGLSIAPRYFFNMYSGPHGPQVLDYIEFQERFARAVSLDVHDLLLLRLYPRDSGWDEEKRWADNDPSLKIYRGTRSIAKSFNESRLCVCSYGGTTFLESFSANYPTVLFWNPNHWEMREAAQPYFDELRRVGILHDTPESAAAQVNATYKDPSVWWMSEEVQVARGQFCHQYARTSEDWVADWAEELRKLAHE